jgi:hypothetical protein
MGGRDASKGKPKAYEKAWWTHGSRTFHGKWDIQRKTHPHFSALLRLNNSLQDFRKRGALGDSLHGDIPKSKKNNLEKLFQPFPPLRLYKHGCEIRSRENVG